MAAWKHTLGSVEEQLRWSVLFALVLALVNSIRDMTAYAEETSVAMTVWSIAVQITLHLYWAFTVPVVLWVMEWIRRNRASRVKALAAHAGMYAVLGNVFYLFLGWVNASLWHWPGSTWNWHRFWLPTTYAFLNAHSLLKYYVPLLLGCTVYRYYRSMREEELKAAELKQQLSESQFRLLKMQLHPHFLFNALHSISTLIHTNPQCADRMLSQLSELLRVSLETTEVVTVPLQEELQYVVKYLEIERIRFSDRLQTSFSIEPGTLALDVPNLILQPLVENAIKHGVSKLAGGGHIAIRVRKGRGGLLIAVEDNGPGIGKTAREGVGTRNVRERLQRLYLHRGRLTLAHLKPQGTRQELFIPVDDVEALFEARSLEYGSAP